MLALRNNFIFSSSVLSFVQAPGSPSSEVSEPIAGWIWWSFIGFIILLLVVDLKLVMNKPHKINTREAAIYSAVWITLGVLFMFVVWAWMGGKEASQYITAYLIEKSLSIDNVFLWAVLFSYFQVPSQYQHRVLFWGIFGALAMRAGFIFAGIALLNSIHWIIYVFGAILLVTAYRIFKHGDTEEDFSQNSIIRFVKRYVPQTDHYRENKFIVVENGRRLATPLLTVLIIVELSDIIFAVDSVPAVLAVTQEKFLVFSSNAFAILGLRALYFLVADLKDRFIYLNNGLAVILTFVGVKFLISEFYKIPTYLSLSFIAIVLATTIILSIRHTKEQEKVKSS